MEYITIKDKAHVSLKMIDDKIGRVCEDGEKHEILVQVQGNTEEISKIKKELSSRCRISPQVETLEQDLLMLTFRIEVERRE